MQDTIQQIHATQPAEYSQLKRQFSAPTQTSSQNPNEDVPNEPEECLLTFWELLRAQLVSGKAARPGQVRQPANLPVLT